MISFYLMSLKGYRVLEEVIKSFGPAIISEVISEKDPNVSKDYYEEIAQLCRASTIPFFRRKDKTSPTGKYQIAISWRWLIADSASLIVIHDSLLPKYRGFNPLVTALINGDDTIGVTALFATEEFDGGNIIYQASVPVAYPITIAQAIDKVSACYIEVVRRICNDIMENRALPSVVQDETKATFSLWRDEKDYHLKWDQPAEVIKRTIDATGFPYRGAMALIDGTPVRIIEAEVGNDLVISNREAGKVIFIKQAVPHVVCGSGILKILRMEDETQNTFTLTRVRNRFE